jgi:rSAM/selenodomain-associated transferase 1
MAMKSQLKCCQKSYPVKIEMPRIVVMARWPAANRCKQRLNHDLSRCAGVINAGESAMRIQRQLTRHTTSVVASIVAARTTKATLAVDGLGPSAARRWGEQLGLTHVELQGRGNLGCRMKRQLLLGQRTDCSTLFIGTDLPDLNINDLHAAITSLESHDLVLGPAEDGGYWLIGFGRKLLERPQDWPLGGIPWGKANVLEQTTAQAAHNQLDTALVAQRNDLDHLADLRPWLG